VNDTFGHLAGDAVLKEIASRIMRSTRPYDMTGRYGGEEFLVILPTCDREQTLNGAERIRAAIAATPFNVGGAEIRLTVSIGATVVPDLAASETEILSLSDLAMYQAKTEGRNRTVLRTSFDNPPSTIPMLP
jgi:diguanylate cyclase (GGDEF)-like protein